MKFFVATKNQHKMSEFKKIFENSGITVLCENDVEINIDDVEETGTTFEENSLIKARAAVKATGMPCIADDSGLCVDALGGKPGVYSARYAGAHGDNAANNKKLLEELKNVPQNKRTAQFVCVIACVFPDGREFTVRGETNGVIATAPQGEQGFGYDPLFVSEVGCFGTISADVKNSVSHRGRAIEKFKTEITKYI